MSTAMLWCSGGAVVTVGATLFAVDSLRTANSALGTMRSVRVGRSLASLLPRLPPGRVRTHIERQVSRAGLRDTCTPEDWFGCLMFGAAVGGGVAGLAVAWLAWSAAIIWVAALLVPWMAHSSLLKRAGRRTSAIAKELPAGIDLLVLCLQSGASLGAAMRIACEKQGGGPVQQLWGEVLAQIRAGSPRAAALRCVMERIDLAPVTSLFTALIQAELRGMSLGAALRAQSAQCLADRFVRAERAALQAPVKLLLPLLTCIFPCTFIVIAVPIAARFIGVGGP
jgi:tight adherence protein C